MEQRKRGGGVVGPLILIAIGILFLLNNLGVLAVDIWRLAFQLWPLLLVAIGLDILVGSRSTAASLGVLVITLLLLVGGIWYVNAQVPAAERAMPGDATNISRGLDGATQGRIEIAPGAAVLRLDAGTEADRLVEGAVRLRRGGRLDESAEREGTTAIYRLASRGGIGTSFTGGGIGTRSVSAGWELRLNREIPLELKVDTGAGESILRLSRLNLTRLDVNTGVGRTTITLPERGRFEARIETGVGQVIVRIPAGMAARIKADAGIGGVHVDSAYAPQGDDLYLSPDYDTADHRVDLEIDGGVGQIVVEEMRE